MVHGRSVLHALVLDHNPCKRLFFMESGGGDVKLVGPIRCKELVPCPPAVRGGSVDGNRLDGKDHILPWAGKK